FNTYSIISCTDISACAGKSEYTPDIGKAFLTDMYGTAVWEELDKSAKSFGRQIRMMDYWLEHEKIAPIKERSKKGAVAMFRGKGYQKMTLTR
ncbi:MAG: hypothetical protein NC190_00005, partial [Bacteroides sp.]|nr:hypothetical protein [Bacteroides sp.]